MNNKINNQKSPFAKIDNDKATRKPLSYAPTDEFKKIFLDFIRDNFDNITRSDAIDLMVKDYIFRYAYKTKGYYGKTLVCTLSKGDINYGLGLGEYEPIDYERFKHYNLRISSVGILDRYAKSKHGDDFIYLDDELIDNYSMIGALAYDKPFNELDPTMKDYVDNKDDFYWGDFNGCSLDDTIVLECALNNVLDANFDGFYCFENTDGTPNKNMHVGVNLVNLSDDLFDFSVGVFPIMYYWYLDQDFNVKIEEIMKIPNDDLEKLFNKYAYDDIGIVGNLNQFLANETGYEIKLKEELKHKRELEQKLYDSEQRIKKLQKAIDDDKKVFD